RQTAFPACPGWTKRVRQWRRSWLCGCACGYRRTPGPLPSRSDDQYGTEIIDIGKRRPDDDKTVQLLEEAVTVIVRERGLGADAGFLRLRENILKGDRAGIVLAAVDPVGVGGDRVHAGQAVERDRQREKKFGAASAAALAAHRDGGFAAR